MKKCLRGQRKRPLPRETGPKGPCDPLPNTQKRKMDPEMPCPNGRGRCLSLGPHSGEGQARWPGGTPRTMTGPPLLVRVKKAAKQNEKRKNNTSTRSKKTPLPPRVQETGLREVPRESKNARGPEWHSDKTPEGKDARPKRVNRQTPRGTKTRKRKRNTRCVWGCAL